MSEDFRKEMGDFIWALRKDEYSLADLVTSHPNATKHPRLKARIQHHLLKLEELEDSRQRLIQAAQLLLGEENEQSK